MIPKKIHYCWFGLAPFPRLVRKCMQTWREVMPDYEICLWNEENSPMDHPFVKQAYAAKKYAFVADYVRFWALYNYGGVYLDTDMYVIKRFDDLLDNRYFSAWETPHTMKNKEIDDTIISCGVIGAVVNCDVIAEIMSKYDSIAFSETNVLDFIVTRITTPLLRNREDVTIYPYDYFYPFPFQERGKNTFLFYKTSNTYAIHLWDISWLPWYKKVVRGVIGFLMKVYTK